MRKSKLLLLVSLMITCSSLTAQVAVNDDGSQPDASAGLDVKFNNKGLLPPRLSTDEMNTIAAPAAGLMIYNTTVNSVFFYDGTIWKMMYNNDGEACGTITHGGQTYQTVIIGNQCWMAENLNIGTAIPGTQNQTNTGTNEKYCYNDNASNCDTYGGLYQWDEMMQYTTTPGAQGICPPSWHLPTDAEWNTLATYAGGGGGLKEEYTFHWASPNTGATNTSGFTAYGGGYRHSSGSFGNLTYYGIFWTSTENGTNAVEWYLEYNSAGVYHGPDNKVSGYSVRCIKN